MHLQPGIFPIHENEYPHVVAVWEASVRATHHFVREADIQFFKPLVLDALPQMEHLAGVRDGEERVAGFIGAAHQTVEMLFLHPDARGMGGGKRLLRHAITQWGATAVDVNEQNEQAVGFYFRMGFTVAGRSERDGMGKPYPLLHLRLSTAPDSATTLPHPEGRHP